MINKFFDEQHNIPKDTLNKFPNLDTMLTQSYQPWLDISWTKTIKQIAELFDLVVVPENTILQRSKEQQV